MADIIIKDGHLWKDGVKLKLEFGNIEQISVLRKYERVIEKFIKGEVEPECFYDVTGHAKFLCICEKSLDIKVNADYEEDVECFDGNKVSCNRCGNKYEFVINKIYNYHGGKKTFSYDRLGVKLIK